MKVTDLFEAYSPPVRNPKLAFRNKGEKVGTGKQGVPIGGSKEWLKTFGATAADIDQALRVVRQSPEYRAVKSEGMSDQSTDRHDKNGSIMFVGQLMMTDGRFKPQKRRMKVTVQPNGKMDETNQNDFHRAPITSAKPRIVPGDAVQSIVKSMTSSLEKLANTIERRRIQAEAGLKKYQKSLKEETLIEAAKGPDWKVQFSFKSADGKDINTGTITVKDFVNKERATAAAEKYLATKYKGRDAKITRITRKPWDKVPVENDA